jgi:hypothetical protein
MYIMIIRIRVIPMFFLSMSPYTIWTIVSIYIMPWILSFTSPLGGIGVLFWFDMFVPVKID